MKKDKAFQNVFYPTIQESDYNWGMVITTAGLQSIDKYASYPPPGHPQGYAFNPDKGRVLNEFQIVYLSKGNGVFFSKNKRQIILKEGSLFMLYPGTWHSYHPDENGWNTYWVGFKGEYVNQLIEQTQFSKEEPIIHVGYVDEITRLFLKIIDEAKNESPGSQQLMSGIMCHLLGYILQLQKREAFDNKLVTTKINKARIMMRERFTNIRPEEIASDLGISYSWFRRAFKEYTGFSPAQYLSQLKLQRAKYYLENSDFSIKQIAEKLEFESADYFSVYFKRTTGQNPSQYRNK